MPAIRRPCSASGTSGTGPHHSPAGFDTWRVLPGQGYYHDPKMLDPELDPDGRHTVVQRTGYVTDLITDDCIDWLDQRDADRPFALLCHHKAPHRSWEPDAKHATMYDDVDIPEPATIEDDHESRADVVKAMHMHLLDLHPTIDLKAPVPPGLTRRARRSAGDTSGTSRSTCASSRRSTTTSAACSTGSTTTVSPTTRSSSTPRTRASSSATTAGSTNG